MSRRRGRALLSLVVVAAVAAGAVAGWRALDLRGERPSKPARPVSSSAGLARVERVVDGDTVVLAGGDRVRIAGINTPEKGEELAAEASALARRLAEGRDAEVRAPVRRRDAYRRLLGDVVVDGRSLREAMLEAGLAHVMLIPPYDPAEAARLLEVEAGARAARRGIWGTPRFAGALHVTSARIDGDDGCHSRVANVSGRPLDLAGYRVRAGRAALDLPRAVLAPGRTVLVKCGEGRDRADGPAQQTVHWADGSSAMTRGETIGVEAPDGTRVDSASVR
ncbi:MAG: thermonuclease family protein [Deltaproteobacteria bacterium]|nr:thermonuclease family protein [Deltaproteobacteria bacterium]